ncbi:hypothetical protein NPIL_578311 [Nephila pilipes]|uniref:Uncharacterized protein n=1 Tax=Nephila pilipes TaxID=299642 RepID=A0A8X6P6W9_NEPPI|nr:hypothetical protein NPIL_578311 [Nephila pilipes]
MPIKRHWCQNQSDSTPHLIKVVCFSERMTRQSAAKGKGRVRDILIGSCGFKTRENGERSCVYDRISIEGLEQSASPFIRLFANRRDNGNQGEVIEGVKLCVYYYFVSSKYISF